MFFHFSGTKEIKGDQTNMTDKDLLLTLVNGVLQFRLDILGKSKLKLKGEVIEKLFIYHALKFIYQQRLRGGETI